MRKIDNFEIACYIYKEGFLDKADSAQYSKLIILNEMLKEDENYSFNLAIMIWSLSKEISFEKIYFKLNEIIRKECY